jgi:hypothetical protein
MFNGSYVECFLCSTPKQRRLLFKDKNFPLHEANVEFGFLERLMAISAGTFLVISLQM